MQWYYVSNGQRLGPVDQAEFDRLVTSGTINSETLVWRDGMREWQPHGTLVPPTLAGAVPVGSAAAGVAGEETQVCAVSGKRYPAREMIQYEGKWISAEHRDEFFQRMREGVTLPGAGTVPGPFGYGGFWKRFCAVFVDGIILWVVNQVTSFAVLAAAGLTGAYSIAGPRLQPGVNVQTGKFFMVLAAIQAFSVLVALSYEIGFIRKFDATPGKMALGLKLLRTDGSKLSIGRIIGRYFSKILSGLIIGIGYLMAISDQEKRTLHDRICDTRVVKTRA